jgi:hypothetical protein
MVDSTETEEKKEAVEEQENIIIVILKKLLEINYFTYGGKKEILK